MTESKLYQVPTRCVVCAQPLHVERVRCDGCGTAVEGRFSAGWIEALSPEQAAFARVFLECRGKIKDVEQALGISYPTVVSRLDEVVVAITGRPAPPRPPGADSPERAQKRKRILDELAAGKLDADEAARRLRGMNEEPSDEEPS